MPTTTAHLDMAIQLATRVHAGQVDKAGMPYILHPLRVMLDMDTPDERVVAVLHDVLEDAKAGTVTAEILAANGFPAEVVQAVVTLTRVPGETYADYIHRVGQSGPLARKVKMADLLDNLDPERDSRVTTPEIASLRKRYIMARVVLAGYEIASRPLP